MTQSKPRIITDILTIVKNFNLSKEDREDLVGEICLAALETFPEARSDPSFAPTKRWITWRAMDWLRTCKRRPTLVPMSEVLEDQLSTIGDDVESVNLSLFVQSCLTPRQLRVAQGLELNKSLDAIQAETGLSRRQVLHERRALRAKVERGLDRT